MSNKCTVIYQVVNNSILFGVDEPDCKASTASVTQAYVMRMAEGSERFSQQVAYSV